MVNHGPTQATIECLDCGKSITPMQLMGQRKIYDGADFCSFNYACPHCNTFLFEIQVPVRTVYENTDLGALMEQIEASLTNILTDEEVSEMRFHLGRLSDGYIDINDARLQGK